MVGCRPDARSQALKRTPATYSPLRPVDVSGTRAPLQVTTWRSAFRPWTLICSRSIEESTRRAVRPATPSSPRTYQGSMAWRSSSRTPACRTEPQTGKRNCRCASNHAGSNTYRRAPGPPALRENRSRQNVRACNGRATLCPSAPACRRAESARTRQSARVTTIVQQNSCARRAASRMIGIPPNRDGRSGRRVKTVCRCRSRCGGCCR